MKLKKTIQEVFHLDLRSLGLFRIGLGLLIIIDLYLRSHDLSAHYTAEGVFPASLWHEFFEGSFIWSLNILNDTLLFQGLLFALSLIAAIAFTVGYRTRWSTLLIWALLCSIQTRNPLILQFGDTIVRVLLFWSLFLPLGATWSLDRIASGEKTLTKSSISSGGSFAFLLQIAFIYWFTAALKTGVDWWQDADALYYALNYKTLSTAFGLWLGQFHQLLAIMTPLTLVFEWIGPLLLFLPWYSGRLRTLCIFFFILFHLGLAISLNLGIFPWVCILAWFALLPSGFWDRYFPKLQQIPPTLWKWKKHFKPRKLSLKDPIWLQTIAVLLIAYVLLWNIRTVRFDWIASWFPYSLNHIGEALHLEQRWGMYAPQPSKIGGWYVIPGQLKNGDQIDLNNLGKKINWLPPNSIANTYQNDRWGNLLTRLWKDSFRQYRPYYADYLCLSWNQNHPDKTIRKLQLYHQQTITAPIGKENATETILLWKQNCPT